MCTYHGSFHEGKNGTKVKVLTFPEECCPKLLLIAQAICASTEKAIVMTSRMSGYVVMLELMRFLSAKQETPFGVATMEELSEFNHVSNLHGEIYRVLVADANQCSEGVSFLAVRRTYISDVPVSPSQFIQQCGRSIRMYGHRGLPDEEQTVTTNLYVSIFPKWMKSSLACWALRAQKKIVSGKEFEKKARELTARLHRAGVKSLSALKNRIDAHGVTKLKSQGRNITEKANLTGDDVIGFLEQNGLWEEAKLLRAAEKKEREKAFAMAEAKGNLTKSIEAADGLVRTETQESIGSALFGRQDTLDTQAGDVSEDEELAPEDEFSKALEEALEDDLDGDTGEGRRNKMPRTSASPGKVPPSKAATMDFDDTNANGAAAGEEPVSDSAAILRSSATATPGASPGGSADAVPEGSPMESPDGSPDASPDALPDGPVGSPDGEGIFPMGSPTETAEAVAAPAAPVNYEAQITAAVEQRALLEKAITLVKEICEEITKAAKAKASQVGSTEGLSIHADLLAKAAAEDKWRAMLDDGFKELKGNQVIGGAFKIAVHQDFEADRANLRQLTAVQVRALRTELIRLDKLWQLVQASKIVDALVNEIDTCSSSETAEPWSAKLEERLKDLRPNDFVKEALKNAAPNLVPEDAPPEQQWDAVSLTSLTTDQVRTLQDDLSKLRVIKQAPQTKPRPLVRAMQALYHAESVEEAELSLLPETADEEALRQLAERSQEFAPALAGMRGVAVDHEVFKHLADQFDEDIGDDVKSESEASDVEKDLVGKKELAPVVLPPGWRLEWVKRKKREAREFVDPAGNRYVSVREVRAALEDWEAHGGQLGKPPDEDEDYAAPSARDAFGWAGEGKRRRLFGKTSRANLAASTEDFFEGAAEEAFADMLDAHELLEGIQAPAAAAETAASGGTSSASTTRPGLKVVLHSLVAKPELNGKYARLNQFVEETGRWEVIVLTAEEGEAAFNVKPTNFTVLPAAQQDSGTLMRRRMTGKTSSAPAFVVKKRLAPAAVKAASPARPALRRRGASAVAGKDDESD